MDKMTLVTGSSGYVGSHTVKFLSGAGRSVVGLDLEPSPTSLKPYLKNFLQSDMADRPAVEAFCRKMGVTDVIHCAAKCLVGESVQFPELYQDYNVRRATAFVDAVQAAGVRRLVFSSTAAVYGEPTVVPIPENHAKKPINPYGESKLEFEGELLRRHESGKMTVGIVRYFNAAGADPEGTIGENHEIETHLIPNAILTALGKRESFDLYGGDYPTRDGTCERDYIHVWDLANAHLKLLDLLDATHGGGIFNLGTGKGYTVKEVLDEIDRQAGTKLKREMRARRPGDPAVLVADPSKANRELRWTPAFSDLPTIVRTALAWHRKE